MIENKKEVPIKKHSKNNNFNDKNDVVSPLHNQAELFEVSTEKEIDGIGMGVLENGIPYLTQTGLAKMCGVETRSIRKITVDWNNEKITPRGKIILDILNQNNYISDKLYISVKKDNQPIHYAYPESVCLAFLEYYAFHSKAENTKEARNNLILLARKTFRDLIYNATEYKIETKQLNEWKYFLDRVGLNIDVVPVGYFSIFKEMADFMAQLITSGVIVDDHTIPDGSVGWHWSSYWKDNKLNEKYGESVNYQHNFPNYFPQSQANGMIQPKAYPESALPTFRKWYREIYIESKFPNYLLNKTKQQNISANKSNNILNAVGNKTKQISINQKNKLTICQVEPIKIDNITTNEVIKHIPKDNLEFKNNSNFEPVLTKIANTKKPE